MPRLLGEILVGAKVITSRQLEEAISNQVVFGGRIGTNLMDLGYVTESVLGNYLSVQAGVPTIDPQAYAKIHTAVAKSLPKGIAERTMSVPILLREKTLHVVMADPNNVAHQDEIRFATGSKLQVYVAPEVRIWYLLNRLYGTKREVRYVTLSRTDQMALRAPQGRPAAAAAPKQQKVLSVGGVEDASQAGDLMSEDEFARMTQDVGMTEQASDGSAAEEVVLLGDVADDESEVLVLDEEVVEGAPVAAAAPAAPGQPAVDDSLPLRKLTLAQATKALQNIEDRDQIARVVLGFASATFKRTGLFLVRNDLVMGWDAAGPGLSREVVERLMVPLSAPSVFKLVFDMKAHFLGAIPKSPVNSRFLKTLGGDPPRSAFVIPILFKGKVVNILYGDNGPNTDATYDIGELLILAMKIPQSFEDLIRRTKGAA